MSGSGLANRSPFAKDGRMTEGSRSLAGFYNRLLRAWSVETGRHWRPDNPAAGQCGVTALVVQDVFGGDILKTDVNGASHFYNLIDGKRIDFTMRQFNTPIHYEDSPSDRSEALDDGSMAAYELLQQRVRRFDEAPLPALTATVGPAGKEACCGRDSYGPRSTLVHPHGYQLPPFLLILLPGSDQRNREDAICRI